MKMDRITFKYWFSKIEDYVKESDEANDAVQKLCKNSYPTIDVGSGLLDAYVKLLEDMINSRSIIEHYVYEGLLYGRPVDIIVDEINHTINSADSLYDAIKEG